MDIQNKIVHGCDYNPDQWLETPEIIDEDIRLMKKAGINSVTLGIFSWSMLEPRENEYNFVWLDEIMDKLYQNGIDVILATPSGARPSWLAQKYPEVLRVDENGIRNEYGVRHNHCLTSLIYREKVRKINTLLAERYKHHPALKMWHISNEYSGECHCELCQQAFREWLMDYYNNDLDLLNYKWWNGFWSHKLTDWSQINSPKYRGENHSSAMKLCWDRFVTDSHISFFENEIAPLRRLTPDIPITTNFMRMYDGINYQKFAKRLDIISWDNYPEWSIGKDIASAVETDSIPENIKSLATFNGKEYEINHICDIIHSNGAKVLGEYKSDFYAGMPSVTENVYGKGKAYYVAFRNDGDLAQDFCRWYVESNNISADTDITTPDGVSIRKRGEHVFILNFNDFDAKILLDGEYINALTNEENSGKINIAANDFVVLR